MPKISVLNMATGQTRSFDLRNEVPDFSEREDRQRGFVRAGRNNMYFQDLVGLVNGSGIARPCVSTKANFIYGGGFQAETDDRALERFYKLINANELLRRISKDIAYFSGFALNVRYNLQGRITEIRHIDFSACRLGVADTAAGGVTEVYVSPDWSRAYRAGADWAMPQVLPVFDPDPEKVKAQIRKYGSRYQGQILYCREYCPAHFYYVPPAWAAADDRLEVDRGIGRFHASNVDNGFFPGMMLYLPGTDWDMPDESGRTKKEAFREWFDAHYKGARNAGEVLKLYGATREDAPQPVFFQPSVNGDMFLSLENNTVKYIPVAFQVPPVLAGISEPGKLGPTQQLLDEMELFQNNVISPEQDRICEVMMQLQAYFHGFKGEPRCRIAIKKPLSYLPDKVLNSMTYDELRSRAGLAPLTSWQLQELKERNRN